MTIYLDGKKLAAKLLAELKPLASCLPRPPHLAVLLIGNDPASHLYVNLKTKAANQTGLKVTKTFLPEGTSQDEIIKFIKIFNQQPEIDAILVQLPLPQPINESEVIKAIDPDKDADGFHPINIEKFLSNNGQLKPGLIDGLLKLISLSGRDFNSLKLACLLVNSPEFGAPLKKALNKLGIEVEIHHQKNTDCLKKADLIISALGQPHYLKIDDFKEQAVVIDVGTTKKNGRIWGDVDPKNSLNKKIFLTPVPGGVGPVTVAMLLWSVYQLAVKNLEKSH